MSFLASMFAEKGFTCIESDLAISTAAKGNSESMMKEYESGKRSDNSFVSR